MPSLAPSCGNGAASSALGFGAAPYVADRALGRVLKASLGYAAEETVALP
jgi:hypothetical protein